MNLKDFISNGQIKSIRGKFSHDMNMETEVKIRSIHTQAN